MPVISRFYGITIKMYLQTKEHNPPHIHAIYQDSMGSFLIENGHMTEGDIPLKGQKLIQEFISCYQKELLEMWETQNFYYLTLKE